MAEATGLSRTTIWAGRRELRRRLDQPEMDLTPERVRAPGGGRHLVEQDDPTLLTALRDLVESSTRGDPQSPLFWTSKSTRKLAEELSAQGHPVTYPTVAALLDDWGYSLQANRKTKEGEDDPDRDAQFEYINRQVHAFQRDGQPVVSVDAKKKELIGDFPNPGREWHRRGHPEEVRAKDFPDKQLGKAIPEGVYDFRRNEGWVSVGVDHDTADFAGASIQRLVAGDGVEGLSPGASAPDHRRCRGQQRLSVTALESGVAAPGVRIEPADLGLPFPARDEQVEQDRAPDVLPHHPELARQAATLAGYRRELDNSTVSRGLTSLNRFCDTLFRREALSRRRMSWTIDSQRGWMR